MSDKINSIAVIPTTVKRSGYLDSLGAGRFDARPKRKEVKEKTAAVSMSVIHMPPPPILIFAWAK